MTVVRSLCLCAVLLTSAIPTLAQSPNTATILVVVQDQTDGLVKDAKVSVVNNATGVSRQGSSGEDGTVVIGALSLTGNYTITVEKLHS
jgi:hypothetical protein